MAATAHLNFSEADVGKWCTGTWYLNGEAMEETTLILGEDTETVSAFVPNYTHDLDLDATVEFVLTYTNHDGDNFSQKASAPIQLETFETWGWQMQRSQSPCPRFLAAGETLTATATVDTPESGQVCTGTWYVDGQEVASEP